MVRVVPAAWTRRKNGTSSIMRGSLFVPTMIREFSRSRYTARLHGRLADGKMFPPYHNGRQSIVLEI